MSILEEDSVEETALSIQTRLKSFGFTKKQDQTLLWTCVAGAHLQCVNNHYAKFEYKGMKLFELQITQINNVSTPTVV